MSAVSALSIPLKIEIFVTYLKFIAPCLLHIRKKSVILNFIYRGIFFLRILGIYEKNFRERENLAENENF